MEEIKRTPIVCPHNFHAELSHELETLRYERLTWHEKTTCISTHTKYMDIGVLDWIRVNFRFLFSLHARYDNSHLLEISPVSIRIYTHWMAMTFTLRASLCSGVAARIVCEWENYNLTNKQNAQQKFPPITVVSSLWKRFNANLSIIEIEFLPHE